MLILSRSLAVGVLIAAAFGGSGCAYQARELKIDKAMAEQRAMQARQDLEAMREEKQEVDRARREKEVALEAQNRRVETLEAELKSTRDKLNAAQLALSQSTDSQTRELATHITQSLEGEHELKSQVGQLSDKVASLQVQILKEEEEKTLLQQELEWVHQERDALEKEAMHLREMAEKQKKELENLQVAQSAGSNQQRDVEKRLTALSSEVAEKEAARKQLEEQLAAAQAQQKSTVAPERVAEAQKLADARLHSQISAGNARLMTEDGRLRIALLTDALFNPGTTQLSEAGMKTLSAAHEVLAITKPAMLIIEGHTDSVPVRNMPYPSNWELAAARATEVTRWLASQPEMDPQRMVAQSRAYFTPLGDNATSAGRRLNRRVELVLVFQ